MNERIQELAVQARFLNKDEESIEYFAELIVQECVEQILTGVRTNPPEAAPPELIQTLVRRIQRHFGVE